MTLAESNRLSWQIHNTAAGMAKKAGACLRCCIEAGCRATDKAGISRREKNDYRMHALCAQRIGDAK